MLLMILAILDVLTNSDSGAECTVVGNPFYHLKEVTESSFARNPQ